VRLTSEGLEIGRYKLPWTEVDDFRRAWFFRVRVVYAPWHELNRREKISVELGKLDFYCQPAYISTAYHTDGEKLDLLLRRWRLAYGR
jgi:hypothetical protein